MPRFETQINQIYLSHPQGKKSSLVLYEEAINASSHLFALLELKDLQRKSDSTSLKKISEIILESFKANKKLAAENLFESALSTINQNLADLAHAGNKSWVGKFSALLALKSGDNIFVTNNGQTSAWLKRNEELMEILPAEKRGIHPLKTFTNFTEGKLKISDILVITTANIFNYISMELFMKILNQKNAIDATNEISKILQDSLTPEVGFAAFILDFDKKTIAEEKVAQATQINFYAPLPEEVEQVVESPSKFRLPKLAIPQIKLPKLKKFEWKYFQNLTPAGKFFLISFSIFALLFIINIFIFSSRSQAKKTATKIENLIAQINNELEDAQSSLIYKNDAQALQQMAKAQTDYEELKKLDETKSAQLTDKLIAVKNQVNKVSTVNEPKVEVELKRHPIYLAKSASGYLLGNQDSNSLSLYAAKTVTDYFLLNSLKSDIIGIAYYQPAGVVVATSDKLYHINTTLKQFEQIVEFANNQIDTIKNINGNLYVHDAKNNQIIKVTFSKNKFNVAATVSTKSDFRDFTMDKDTYLLYPDSLNKVTGGQVQAFTYPTLTDEITNATKIQVVSNLYILEPQKKRLVIMSKNGVLQNQIYFPTTTAIFDFFVDEAGRSIYLLSDNQLLRITF